MEKLDKTTKATQAHLDTVHAAQQELSSCLLASVAKPTIPITMNFQVPKGLNNPKPHVDPNFMGRTSKRKDIEGSDCFVMSPRSL